MFCLYYYPESRCVCYERQGRKVIIGSDIAGWRRNVPLLYDCMALLGILRTTSSKSLLFVRESAFCGEWADTPIYQIKKVGCLLLEGASNDEDVEGVRKLIEEHNFYYTFGNILRPEFQWNANMRNIFESYILDEEKHPAHNMEVMNRHSPLLAERDLRPQPNFDRQPKRDKIKVSEFMKQVSRSRREEASPPYESNPRIKIVGYGSDHTEFAVVEMFCGYFEENIAHLDNYTTFRIMSSISTERIGTRLQSRGADINGNASFLVETKFGTTESNGGEEITNRGFPLCDFTVMRGTIPLFWEQHEPLKPYRIVLGTDEESNELAFVKHFDKLEITYSEVQDHRVVAVLDLLGNKKHEKRLREKYREYCKHYDIGYMHIDLNKYASNFDELKHVFERKLTRFVKKMMEKDSLREKSVKKRINKTKRI